jgi:hypothetical protein
MPSSSLPPLRLVFFILAALCFALAAYYPAHPQYSRVSAIGLLLLTLAFIF